MVGALLRVDGFSPCVGITVVAPEAPTLATVAGHELAMIPEGFGVIGTPEFEDAPPHWAYFPSFWVGTTATSEAQYREETGRAWNASAPLNHPVTIVTHKDALAYLGSKNSKHDLSGGYELRLPREQAWEYAARGSAVNVRAMMENEGLKITPEEIATFIEGRFENLVFGALGQIFNNPEDGIFRKFVEKGLPFYGWRVHATPSGRATKEEAWYDRPSATDVKWGPASEYGLYGMLGGVWEWMSDYYVEGAYVLGAHYDIETPWINIRGASWGTDVTQRLRAGYRRYGFPDEWGGYLSFRVVASRVH
jgi:formylglycine-generating enzyme required for sulfatase activity